MRHVIIILGMIFLAGCGNKDVVNSTTGGSGSDEALLFEKSGKVDSLNFIIHGTVNQALTPFAYLNYQSFRKTRVTFTYKATADSLKFNLWKYSDAYLFKFTRVNINTNGEYLTFDSTFSKSDTANGTYYKTFQVGYDTCTFVVRDLKIYGVN